MKRTLLILLFLSGWNLHSSFAQQTAATLKDKVVGKWTYQGTEEFGVVTLDSLQKKDKIEFTADNKFTRVFKGKEESGNYKVSEPTRQIFLSDPINNKTTMYKVKFVTATSLTLDYQTPDLVHTLYQFKKD